MDVVALNEEEGVMLCGEAKWSTKKVGIDVLKALKKKANAIELKRTFKKKVLRPLQQKGIY